MADKKEAELIEAAATALEREYGGSHRALAPGVVQVLADITPPETQFLMEMITMRPGAGGGGRSVKPGNIRLNLRKMIVALAGGTLTAVGIASAPWMAVLGALVIWDSVYSCLGADLDDGAASVAWTLWKHADDESTVAKEGLIDVVNAERAKHNQNPLTPQQVRQSLWTLEKMRCISTSKGDDSRWWLREWVRVKYT